MEEEKAIELAEEFTKMDFSNPMGWTGYYDIELNELSQAVQTVLNMLLADNLAKDLNNNIKAKNKANKDLEDLNEGWKLELEKKDKQIDLMAEFIDVELSSLRLETILNRNVKPLESYKEDIKQYFERKSEE